MQTFKNIYRYLGTLFTFFKLNILHLCTFIKIKCFMILCWLETTFNLIYILQMHLLIII